MVSSSTTNGIVKLLKSLSNPPPSPITTTTMIKLKKLHFLLTTLAILSLASLASAASIEFSMGLNGGAIQNPNASTASDGDLVLVGTFTSGFDFGLNANNYAVTLAAFSQYGSTTIGSGVGVPPSSGMFDANIAVPGGATTNAPLYMWIFNNAVAGNATAWAIVTNPSSLWLTPGGALSTNIGGDDTGTVIASGAHGNALGSVPSSNIRMATVTVPEPTSIALLSGGLLMVGSMIRRRK